MEEEEEEEKDKDPEDIEGYYGGSSQQLGGERADAFCPKGYQFTGLTYKESECALSKHMTSLVSVLKYLISC